MSFLGHFQQNLAKPNYLIQNLALMMVQNTKTTGIRSMRGEISLCYISRRRFKTLLWDLLTSTRTTGQPVVDDWDCYKTLVKSFKNQCGAKMEYDMKYAGALANICNMGVDVKKSVAAIEEACAH
ncbi:BnaC01g32720D [Brassica napus]|uniref:BnaC01g32720D protein n=1 Tax=Brassica napus TaxID=3708 RepID=A0A078IJL4_BRANA|nr:BnaC01g32720D [Brassica napus]